MSEPFFQDQLAKALLLWFEGKKFPVLGGTWTCYANTHPSLGSYVLIWNQRNNTPLATWYTLPELHEQIFPFWSSDSGFSISLSDPRDVESETNIYHFLNPAKKPQYISPTLRSPTYETKILISLSLRHQKRVVKARTPGPCLNSWVYDPHIHKYTFLVTHAYT